MYLGASILLHKGDRLGPASKELWSYPKLLNILEQIVGPEIAGHPIWNVRIKLPFHDPEVVPWHQDNGYLTDDGHMTMLATAWIPMLDTDMKNGGMQMVRRTHQSGELGKEQFSLKNKYLTSVKEQD